MIEELMRRLLPRTMIKIREQSLEYWCYADQKWSLTAPDAVPADGLFGQRVLLIPDDVTLFRSREFPLAHVGERDLAEAISLDVQAWSPWDGDSHIYYWPSQQGDCWQVAVWIWPKDILADIRGAGELTPTHVMPERAWKIAAIQPEPSPVIFLDSTQNCQQVYAIIQPSAPPLRISECPTYEDSKRFWRTLDKDAQQYPLLRCPDYSEVFPDNKESNEVALGLPLQKALKHARQDSSQDWLDPSSWIKPVGLVLLVYSLWLLGSALIFLQKGTEVGQLVAEARHEAIEVIEQRDNVTRAHGTLELLYGLRVEQVKFEVALAAISRTLPEDAWLDAIQYDYTGGGWLDISGKAEHSSGLAAILEEVPEIEHAMFLSDIRREKLTGLEPFKIRLKLAQKL